MPNSKMDCMILKRIYKYLNPCVWVNGIIGWLRYYDDQRIYKTKYKGCSEIFTFLRDTFKGNLHDITRLSYYNLKQ